MGNIEKINSQPQEKKLSEEEQFAGTLAYEMIELADRIRGREDDEAMEWQKKFLDLDEQRFKKFDEPQKKEILELLEEKIENQKKDYKGEKNSLHIKTLNRALDLAESLRRQMKIIISIKLPPEEE